MLASEINKVLEGDPQFLGCYPFDALPEFPKKFPVKIIVNTGSVSTKGEHWVALLLDSKTCLYFDSFGLSIINIEILQYLANRYKTVTYSDKCIQYFSSILCGKYCIDFIQNVRNAQSFGHFLDKFDDINLAQNDVILFKSNNYFSE